MQYIVILISPMAAQQNEIYDDDYDDGYDKGYLNGKKHMFDDLKRNITIIACGIMIVYFIYIFLCIRINTNNIEFYLQAMYRTSQDKEKKQHPV